MDSQRCLVLGWATATLVHYLRRVVSGAHPRVRSQRRRRGPSAFSSTRLDLALRRASPSRLIASPSRLPCEGPHHGDRPSTLPQGYLRGGQLATSGGSNRKIHTLLQTYAMAARKGGEALEMELAEHRAVCITRCPDRAPFPHSACATNRSRCYDFLSSIFQQLRCGHHHAVARSSPFLPFGMQCKAVAVLRIPLIHLAAPPRQPCGFFSSTITRTRTKTKTIARTSRTRPRRGCGSLFLRVTEVVPRRDRRTERTRTADAERNAPGGGQVSVEALRAHSSAVAIIPVQKRWELKINEADGYLVSHIWMNPGAPEGVGARYQPLSDSLRSRRSLCETRIHPPRGGPRAWWILRSAQPIAHSSIIIPRFFFHSLRAFRRNELLHTLTLGQALMPAGLPFERRICGPIDL